MKSTLAGRLGDLDAEDLQIVERLEVADVETDTGAGPEEQQNAAAGAPRQIVLVDLGDAGTEVRLRFEHARSDECVRTDAEALLATEGNPEDQIARRRERAAAAQLGLAVEVWTETDVALEAEDATAHEENARAPVELLGVERFREFLAGIAAEIHTEERNEQCVCPRGNRREHDRDERSAERSG